MFSTVAQVMLRGAKRPQNCETPDDNAIYEILFLVSNKFEKIAGMSEL